MFIDRGFKLILRVVVMRTSRLLSVFKKKEKKRKKKEVGQKR